jgi:hypothetical protein
MQHWLLPCRNQASRRRNPRALRAGHRGPHAGHPRGVPLGIRAPGHRDRRRSSEPPTGGLDPWVGVPTSPMKQPGVAGEPQARLRRTIRSRSHHVGPHRLDASQFPAPPRVPVVPSLFRQTLISSGKRRKTTSTKVASQTAYPLVGQPPLEVRDVLRHLTDLSGPLGARHGAPPSGPRRVRRNIEAGIDHRPRVAESAGRPAALSTESHDKHLKARPRLLAAPSPGPAP